MSLRPAWTTPESIFFFLSYKTPFCRAEVVGQQLRTYTVLTENPGSILNTHITWFITARNSSSKGANTLSWRCEYRPLNIQIHAHTDNEHCFKGLGAGQLAQWFETLATLRSQLVCQHPLGVLEFQHPETLVSGPLSTPGTHRIYTHAFRETHEIKINASF